MNLASKKCQQLDWSKFKKMKGKEAGKYLAEVPGWELDEDDSMISKSFKFTDFTEAMTFVNRLAEVAEKENHHPDIHIFYNRVNLDIWTHELQGLHENDFILAAKINIL